MKKNTQTPIGDVFERSETNESAACFASDTLSGTRPEDETQHRLSNTPEEPDSRLQLLSEDPLPDPCDRHFSQLRLPLQEINCQAMRYLGSVLRFMGLNCRRERNHFVCDEFEVDGQVAQLVVYRYGYGQWSLEGVNPPANGGWYLLSLAELVWRIGPFAAASKLKRILRAFETREGLDELEECGLNAVVGGQALARVPDEAPPLPPLAGCLATPGPCVDVADDHPLHSSSGSLIGYIRGIQQAGTVDRYSGLGRMLYFPLTCWQMPDGSIGWKNRAPKGLLPLVGLNRLFAAPLSQVVLADDQRSAERAEIELRSACNLSVVGVSLMPIPGSLLETDLSPLSGRTVYILVKDVRRAESIRNRLLQINRRTRVSIIEVGIDFSVGEPQPPVEEGDFAYGWTFLDYVAACLENGWRLRISCPAPTRPMDAEFAFGDFVVREDGIYRTRWKDGVPVYERLSSRIDVVASARSNVSADWGVCLEFEDLDGVLHAWCVPRSLLNGDMSYCKQLLDLGAYVSPYQSLRQSLTDCLLTWPVEKRARSVFKPGWDGNLFVFPDSSYAGHSGEMVTYQTSAPGQRAFGKQGCLEDWKQHVARYCEGNSRLMLAVATALTGPVVPLLGEESGGFHFTGDSSCGKTTALYPACSVWGPPVSFINRWRATANGIEAKAVQHNHTLFAMDEMSQISPQEAGETVYMLANGQGKLRALQNGSSREAETWQLMFLSTGEVGLEQHMASAGLRVMAGQQTRLIDVEADAGAGHGLFDVLHGRPHGADLSMFLKEQASRWYGTAGRAWVTALADPDRRPQLLAQIRASVEAFCSDAAFEQAQGQVRRVIRRFGLVAAVAEACVAQAIVPWRPGEATVQIRRCARQWIRARGGVGNLEVNQALEQLRRVLVERGESGFTTLGMGQGFLAEPGRVTVHRLGFRQEATDGHTDYYILPDAFKTEVCTGMNLRHAIGQLKQAGALVLGSDGKAQVNKRLPGLGVQRVYHVRSTVLGQGLEGIGVDLDGQK